MGCFRNAGKGTRETSRTATRPRARLPFHPGLEVPEFIEKIRQGIKAVDGVVTGCGQRIVVLGLKQESKCRRPEEVRICAAQGLRITHAHGSY